MSKQLRPRTLRRLLSLVAVLGLVASACSGSGNEGASGGDESDGSGDTGSGEGGGDGRVEVRWLVGLGTGSEPENIPVGEGIAADFNNSQDKIKLVVEFVENDVAQQVLSTQIAAGNAPDIIGPLGIGGRGAFKDALLDLSTLKGYQETDLSDYDQAVLDFYEIEGVGRVGIPFLIFPSFLFVNYDLFDEAGLEYPPQTYGDPYMLNGKEVPWNTDTLMEISRLLSVDGNGNDATSSDFDPDNIVQFGFGTQWQGDLRANLTLFGADKFYDSEGNAVISDNWRNAVEWYYESLWTDYASPTVAYGESEILGGDNWFNSGNLAMDHINLWYTCCIEDLAATWNTGIVPMAPDGSTTAKLHADTFSILRFSDHPEEAFIAMSYLIDDAAETLSVAYGGMPAKISLQDGFFERLDEENGFEGINWQVAIDSLSYVDNPSHDDGAMPNQVEAIDKITAFQALLDSDPNLDIQAEIDKFLEELQTVFDAAE